MLFVALFNSSSPVQIMLVCLYLLFAWLLCSAVTYALGGDNEA